MTDENVLTMVRNTVLGITVGGPAGSAVYEPTLTRAKTKWASTTHTYTHTHTRISVLDVLNIFQVCFSHFPQFNSFKQSLSSQHVRNSYILSITSYSHFLLFTFIFIFQSSYICSFLKLVLFADILTKIGLTLPKLQLGLIFPIFASLIFYFIYLFIFLCYCFSTSALGKWAVSNPFFLTGS